MIRQSCCLTLLLFASLAFAELPAIKDARIAEPPPGATVAAGFLTIQNNTDDSLVINGASSNAVKKVELHLSTMVDDVARMEKQEQLTVDPGASLILKHGSYHLMLMGIKEPLKAGQEIPVILDTNQGPINFVMPVIKGGMSMNHDAG